MAEQKLDTEVRREQIAEAALQLVASQGVKSLSIAAVARRVGLVPSGIYRHFKSKGEVLDAVLDLLHQRLMENVAAARAETTDPLERLRGIFLRHVQFIREGRAFPRIVFADEVFGGYPDRRDRVQRIVSDYLGAIGQCVRDGQQQGRFRAELVPQSVALLFLGMIVPSGVLWHLTEGGFNVTQHAGRLWQMFCTAIAADGQASRRSVRSTPKAARVTGNSHRKRPCRNP
jgi:AcrR family transcriptional regulator